MSKPIPVTTVQLQRLLREAAWLRTAAEGLCYHLDALDKMLDVIDRSESRTLTGSIQGLPGTVTVAGFGWEDIGDGVMVPEEHA